jgi:hypothetical protein
LEKPRYSLKATAANTAAKGKACDKRDMMNSGYCIDAVQYKNSEVISPISIFDISYSIYVYH